MTQKPESLPMDHQSAVNVAPAGPSAMSVDPPAVSIMEEDVYAMTPHVKVGFVDIFREAESAQGFSFMSKVNAAIYKWTHFACYGTLAMFLSPLLSFMWAIMFAFYHLMIVWCTQPLITLMFMTMRVNGMMINAAIRTFLDPCHKSVGLIFSSIKGVFQVADSNLNVKLTTKGVHNV